MINQYKILLLEKPCEKAIEILSEVAQIIEMPVDGFKNLRYLDFYNSGFTGIFTMLKKITASDLPFDGFNVLGCPCTGIEHITNVIDPKTVKIIYLDDEWKKSEGLKVTSTSEHTFSLILQLAKRKRMQLIDKNIGIVGHGRLGRMIEKYANAFNMNVAWVDKFTYGLSSGVDIFSRAEVFKYMIQESDILTFNVPFNEETLGMINREMIYKMKKGVLIINTSRWQIVDEKELFEAIKNNHVGGYASDFDPNSDGSEPERWNLWFESNFYDVIQTPHIGGNCIDARESTDIYIAQKMVDYLKELKVNVN